MAQIKIKRGLSSNLTSVVLSDGEPAYTTDSKKLYIGNSDGTKTLVNPNLDKNSVGLGNVDNTSDTSKPVSAAMQAALEGKVDRVAGKGLSSNDYDATEKGKVSAAHTHSQVAHAPSGAQANIIEAVKLNGAALTPSSKAVDIIVSKASVGLGNVDNTPDAAKPISTATQAALNNKANVNSPALTGTPTTPTAAASTNNTQIASTAYVKAAIDSMLAASEAMRFKGTLGTGGTVTALPASHKVGDTYKAIMTGNYAGNACEIGDMIICITSGSAASDAHWTVVQSNIDGAVTSSESSVVADTVPIFSGTAGTLIKGSGKTVVTAVDASANIPTSHAVKTFVESKGYLTASSVIDGGTF